MYNKQYFKNDIKSGFNGDNYIRNSRQRNNNNNIREKNYKSNLFTSTNNNNNINNNIFSNLEINEEKNDLNSNLNINNSSNEVVNNVSNYTSNINSNEVSDEYPCITTWDQLDLPINLLRGIFAYGFEHLSPIQQKAIKPIIDGRDVIAQAQSGTGKTATFSIGALASLDLSKLKTQVLILSPTRELACQTSKVISNLGDVMDGLQVQTLFGGCDEDNTSGNSSLNSNSFNTFIEKDEPHIICGCPGKVFDNIRRGKITTSHIKLLILDEADEMLSIGFKDQVYNIFQNLNNDVQVALFSATLPDNTFNIINKIMRNPVRIIVQREKLSLDGIRQYFVHVEDDKHKYNSLKNLFANISMGQCIIYCNSVKRVQDLYDAMKNDDFPVCRIHSSMNKQDRNYAFNNFKNGNSRVLISSNITSRGIDIQQVSIVVNFDLPKCVHTYLHRIGRSGRWGRKGVGINFITRRDINSIKNIEYYYSINIEELPDKLDF